MVIDECHQVESELMSFIGFSLSDKPLREYGIILPKLKTAMGYANFLMKNKIPEVIQNIINTAKAHGDLAKEDEWTDIQRRCDNFLGTVEGGNWVALHKTTSARGFEWNVVELKPIYVRKMANSFIFDKADKILMMSATVLSATTIYDALGIDKSEAYATRFGSRFPVENRPIFYTPVGSLSFKNKAETLPKIVPAVDEILNKYVGQKGIVHTHNFEISNLLISKCKTRGRMLFQKDFETKAEMLEEHARRDDTVIVAPAMHEGLDLKNDLSRFQVVVKMPYPPIKGNPQLEARISASQEYYDWLTALKLVQGTGRSVRSETDWAHTYILDSDFGWFQRKADSILPKWFKEAIQ
jgi:Rad3-related DNA helicase